MVEKRGEPLLPSLPCGKSMILALSACYLAIFRDWKPYLSAGERGTIEILAIGRRQARAIHDTREPCRQRFRSCSVVDNAEDELVLSNGT
jgi:hypothetical protein